MDDPLISRIIFYTSYYFTSYYFILTRPKITFMMIVRFLSFLSDVFFRLIICPSSSFNVDLATSSDAWRSTKKQ